LKKRIFILRKIILPPKFIYKTGENMPKGKSAKDYKTATKLNNIFGAIMLAALIIGLYTAFQFLMKVEFLENTGTEKNKPHTSQGTDADGKKEKPSAVKNVKEAADKSKKIEEIR
jgi:hypothetical protein